MGCHSEEPDINSPSENIEYKKYHYGEKTGKLFENYKNIIRVLKEEFNIEMDPNAKGFYIETIFTDEVETIIKFDKEKLINQICSYVKKEDVYFVGNNQSDGKIEDDNGKALILVDDKVSTLYSGKIHKNKICCLFLNLDEVNEKAILKIPNIAHFNQDSQIQTIFDKHKLKYKSSQERWRCHFCFKYFDISVDSFGCRECDFYLCLNCLFSDENDSIYIKYEIKDKKLNELKLFNSDFVRNNKNICTILYNKEEFPLSEKFSCNNENQNAQKLEIRLKVLKGINKLISMKNMFCLCNFKSITISQKRFGVENMFGMFYDCKELEYICFPVYNTSSVTNMSFMFHNCRKLEKIEGLEKFNTKQVINMKNMFFGCHELKNLDLSSFDTSKVEDMSFMFSNNYKLEQIIGIEKFNMKHANNISFMFNKCQKLEFLDLSKFDLSSINYMENIFCDCNNKIKIIGKKKFKYK